MRPRLGRKSPAASERKRSEPVERRPEQGNPTSKKKRRDVGEGGARIAELFVARGVERVGDEEGGANGERACESEVAGAKGPRKLRLAQTENDEGDELQDEAGAVENQVDGDELLKGQAESERPGETTKEHADPGSSAAIAALKDARQHAIAGHGDGQAGVAHHERVEHADAADDSAGNDGHGQKRTAERGAGSGPRTGGEAIWERPPTAIAASGRT